METALVLGLDLGTNSAGWALIEHKLDHDGRPTIPVRLVDAGARIFQEGVEAKSNESRNVARRKARALRRQHQRRTRRRDALKEYLQKAGLLPTGADGWAGLMRENPYALRAQGLDRPLTRHELGRALYHLGQRRGFKSNRKADRKADKNEGKIVKEGITALRKEMEEKHARTLGEYLSTLDPHEEKVRRNYTSREMYEDEFDRLWDAQLPHHPGVLTDSLRKQIYEIIFRQRPLKIQKNLVGECELEPGKKRSPRGTWYAQQFRMLQDVSHLEFPDAATGEVRKLTDEQRAKLIATLQTSKEMTFDRIRKPLLGLLEAQRFNFEEANHREKLKGNTTEWNLRQVFKKDYEKLSPQTRDEIVHALLFVEDQAVIRRHGVERWGLSEDAAEKLAGRDLESGYLHLSQKAIQKLLPHLEKGLTYMDAVEAAGYQRPDQRTVAVRDELLREDLPDLRNPIVMAALHQTRRVVNDIALAYGRPAIIRVEMARDLKVSLKKRSEILSEQKENRKQNEAAYQRLEEEFGLSNPGRDDLVKYKLWIECGQTCPYTGRIVAKEALFSEDWDVEHILPLPRSGDNSFMNKTLCWAPENRQHKLDKTPWEAYGGDERKWGEILRRIQRLPYPKRRRFLMKEIPDDFITRQLNDTRYIAREARGYLETLVGKNNVQIGKGGVTAELRRRWGLNNLLSSSGEKTREDHRHHAVDAVVVALTTPAAIQQMSRLSAYGYKSGDSGFPPPWEGFRDEVKRRIQSIVVAHRAIRKLRGALHEETNYGILNTKDEKGQPLYAVRKSLEPSSRSPLTRNELDQIADQRVREIVLEHLRKYGADLSKRDAHKSSEWKKAMESGNLPSLPNRNGPPVPIRKVRLHKPSSAMIPMKDGQGEIYRAVESGSNHHIVIFEHTDGKKKGTWDGDVISAFEAARRARSNEPIIQRELGEGRKFIMSLSINEIVKVEENGNTAYWRVQKVDAASKNITFRLHTAANLEDNAMRRNKAPNGLKNLGAIKVAIDPLGREHPAHD